MTGILLLFHFVLNAQNDLEGLVKEKYGQVPIEGVRLLTDGIDTYLISLAMVSTAEHQSRSTMNRVAMIKARREVLKFLEGSEISSETLLSSSEEVSIKDVTYYEKFIDEIRETASGWVQGMEVLTSWYTQDDSEYVLVIYKLLN